MITKTLVIKGKVQGVFFRATAKEKAEKLGLNGWVKNTNDGGVEVMVSGSEECISQFVDWCWQGPSGASVTGVDTKDVATEHFSQFTILRN